MYGSSYMCRHYIDIFRQRSYYLLRDAQLSISQKVYLLVFHAYINEMHG
jgi:hypothetical protein